MKPIERPIIFVGAPRSGTTVMFNVFAARPDLAWFSQHLSRLPRWPSVSLLTRLADTGGRLRKSIDRSDRRRHPLEKLRVGPSEAYGVWRHYCGERFLFDFLRGVEATEEERRGLRDLVAKVLRYQGKDRFATKITGPVRIQYLSSIFDDALFVHVIRDGRAVVNSLLDVHFWRDSWREGRPAWAGGLSAEDLERWRELGQSPLVLAALQWAAIVRIGREEAQRFAADRYAEVRYEDFVADAPGVLDEVSRFCGLEHSPEAHEFLSRRVSLRDMNYRWRERFDPDQVALLNEAMGEELAALGYRDGSGAPSPGVITPFAAGDEAQRP